MVKQIYFLFFCIIFSLTTFYGQKSKYDILGYNAISSIDISFSEYQTLKNYYFNTVGIQITTPVCSANIFNCDMPHTVLSYKQIIPKEKTLNDTLNYFLTGFRSAIYKGLSIINKNENTQLAILLGFEFGRLRLYGNPLLKKKNGYFAPKIEIQPKFKIKRFVIGGSFGYGYDISNPNWKNTWFSKDKSYTLDKLSQSGFSYQAFIGWSFN